MTKLEFLGHLSHIKWKMSLSLEMGDRAGKFEELLDELDCLLASYMESNLTAVDRIKDSYENK